MPRSSEEQEAADLVSRFGRARADIGSEIGTAWHGGKVHMSLEGYERIAKIVKKLRKKAGKKNAIQ